MKMKMKMKKIISLVTAVIILSTALFAKTENITKQAVFKALTKLYGPNFENFIQPVKLKRVFSPVKNVEVYSLICKNRTDKNKKITIPVIIFQKRYITPFVIDIIKNKNVSAVWNFKAQSPEENLKYPEDTLIYRGDKDCKNKMAIFSDPECPFCRRFVPEFIKMAKAKNFCIYLYEFPLSFHKHAMKYSKWLTALLEKAPISRKADIVTEFYRVTDDPDKAEKKALEIAKSLGLTEAQFYKIAADKSDSIIQEHKQIADKVNVRGTPTVFINGKKVNNGMIGDIINSITSGK